MSQVAAFFVFIHGDGRGQSHGHRAYAARECAPCLKMYVSSVR